MKKVAIAGAAHIHTPNFVRLLKEHDGTEVVSLWDHRRDRAGKYAEELRCAVAERPEELWSDPQIEAIIVCSETDRHRDLVIPAARAGKHLFVEKPLGFAADDAMEMAREIEQAGVLFQTGYFMRGRPEYRCLRQLVSDGRFGRLTRVRHSNCHAGSLKGWFDSDYRWMAEPKVAGCGAFGDLGTHSLDLLMWLFGRPEAVTADIRVVTGRYGDCDESGTALLKFPGGFTGLLAGAWVDLDNPVSCEISGTEGFAYIRNGELFLNIPNLPGADGQRPWRELPPPLPHAFLLFLDALAGKEAPLVTPAEAAERSFVMQTLYEANGRWLNLNYS